VRCFGWPSTSPPDKTKLTDLATLLRENPDSAIYTFPESTTTNGRGVLPLSPALLNVPPDTRIFPLNIRYTPQSVVTPVPRSWVRFFWNICSRPTHTLRIRIAEAVYNSSLATRNGVVSEGVQARSTYEHSEGFSSEAETLVDGGEDSLSPAEQKVLDRIAEDLARLGRTKRVGLGVKEKIEFARVWLKVNEG
jgi:1-acylglycerol-3-phosphate O-acyltransferase